MADAGWVEEVVEATEGVVLLGLTAMRRQLRRRRVTGTQRS